MEDNVKRNKRIAEWQKDKRVIILVNDKPAVKARAEEQGFTVNGYINKLIAADLDQRKRKSSP